MQQRLLQGLQRAVLGGVGGDLPGGILRRGPGSPAIRRVEDVGVLLPVERGDGDLVLFESVELFQEQQPRRLLGAIELAGAASILPQDVVDVFEGLFEHAGSFLREEARHSKGARQECQGSWAHRGRICRF